MTPDLAVLTSLIVALAMALGALVSVTVAVAWLDSPRVGEPDRSRGSLAPDAYARLATHHAGRPRP